MVNPPVQATFQSLWRWVGFRGGTADNLRAHIVQGRRACEDDGMESDSGEFSTIDELVAFVVERGGCAEADVRRFVDAMLQGDHFGRKLSLDGCWYKIAEFDFLVQAGVPPHGARWGWVTREGKFWSSAHGAHEILLKILDIDVSDAERAGWVRLAHQGVQCAYRMTREQRRQVEACGFAVDEPAERLKQVWTAEEAVLAPR